MKKKNLAFTLAEVLIVIGIIGVVAALTLPNLNHATGDKENLTRLQKAYSILSEANDRVVAIYGPISSWKNCRSNNDEFAICYMKRIGEFLKISKSCDESGDEEYGTYSSCESLRGNFNAYQKIIYQLPDGMTFTVGTADSTCGSFLNGYKTCISEIFVDVNGTQKGKNKEAEDIFAFAVNDEQGIIPSGIDSSEFTLDIEECIEEKKSWNCSFWPFEYGNLDYLKTDSTGKCNDSNIILDGTTNTSCH